MSELFTGNANELAATLGISVLVFFSLVILGAIMILYIRSEGKKWVQREKNTTDVYQSIITQITQTRDKDFELLKGVLSDNRDQINLLRSVIEKLKSMQHDSDNHRDANDTALRDIFLKLAHLLENRCVNHLKTQLKIETP
jgi:hypothetical protein